MPVVSDYTALISGSTINGQTGAAAFISYSFPTAVPAYLYSSYPAAGLATFQAFSIAAQDVARAAIQAFSAVSGITFLEVAPGLGDIKFMSYDFPALGSTAAGFAYYPTNGYVSAIASDVFIGLPYTTGLHIMLHELGHALGLKHPFDGSVTLDPSVDNFANTVMSYTPGGSPGTVLGQFDIAAIQYMYGTAATKGTGSVPWSWNDATDTLTQTGTAAAETIYGIGGTDVIDAGGGNDTIVSRDGDDRIDAGAGDDVIRLGHGRATVLGGDGNDQIEFTFSGSDIGFSLDGGAGADRVSMTFNQYTDGFLSLSDLLSGGSVLTGVESVTLQFFAFTTANGGLQGFDVIGSAGNENIYTGNGDDIIEGLAGTDTLYGFDGNDQILGGEGADTIRTGIGNDIGVGEAGNDYIAGEAGDDLLSGGEGADTLEGGSGSDTVYGGAGNDRIILELTDAGGSDLADGGAGSDTLVLRLLQSTAAVADLTNLAPLQLSATSFERFEITGTASGDTFTDSAANGNGSIQAGAGGDIIYGGGWNDDSGTALATNSTGQRSTYRGEDGDDVIHLSTLASFAYGGAGADRFVFDRAQDLDPSVSHQLEDFATGVDKLDLSQFPVWKLAIAPSGPSSAWVSGVTQTGSFSIFVRNPIALTDILVAAGTSAAQAGTSGGEVLTGDVADNYIDASGGNDTLSGLAGNDVLDGGTGNDNLVGGQGDDTYFVGSAGDLVFENAGEGDDLVLASASVYLHAQVERLTLTASAGAGFGVGNDLANRITGNSSGNLLLGGAGADTVRGAGGNDNLYGEDGADTLYGDAGIDYLAGGTGNDELWGGSDADALHGEDGNDTLFAGTGFVTDILTGGAGDDLLDGASGEADYDLLDGDAGNDTYRVDTGDDLTFEDAGGGTDTVIANVTVPNAGVYLYANVENLVLEGTTAFGVGNGLDNVLTGSASSNWLLGGAGNDTLNGKQGRDVLFGEAGADTFVFESGTGGDVIGDFQAGTDRISLVGYGLTFAQLQTLFAQVGNVGAIQMLNGDVIVLHNVTMASLTASDFIIG